MIYPPATRRFAPTASQPAGNKHVVIFRQPAFRRLKGAQGISERIANKLKNYAQISLKWSYFTETGKNGTKNYNHLPMWVLLFYRNRNMNTEDVAKKTQSALKYCGDASTYTTSNGGKPWKYLLIPHDAVMHNMRFDGLASCHEVCIECTIKE